MRSSVDPRWISTSSFLQTRSMRAYVSVRLVPPKLTSNWGKWRQAASSVWRVLIALDTAVTPLSGDVLRFVDSRRMGTEFRLLGPAVWDDAVRVMNASSRGRSFEFDVDGMQLLALASFWGF